MRSRAADLAEEEETKLRLLREALLMAYMYNVASMVVCMCVWMEEEDSAADVVASMLIVHYIT